MIVLHAKPSRPASALHGKNIMRRVNVDLAFKNSRGGIGCELIRDKRVCRKGAVAEKQLS
jgi:hypothetical protein